MTGVHRFVRYLCQKWLLFFFFIVSVHVCSSGSLFTFCFSLVQVSNCRGLPMFELVDSQPSHLIGADVINLTPGNLYYCLFIDSEF